MSADNFVVKCRNYLEQRWNKIAEEIQNSKFQIPNISDPLKQGIRQTLTSKTKTYHYVIPTQVLAKIINKDLDCRSIQASFPYSGAFDARTIAHEIIVEFDRRNSNVLGGSSEPYGFSMKGCRFNCKFCYVPKKEGKPYVYNEIDEILINPNGGNRLMLLDNDFFGGENWKANLERIIELKMKVCFVQGLNIRIITHEQASLLAKCNYQNSKFNQKYLTFAWDKYKDGKLIENGIKICNDAGIPTRHMQFFVLIGFDTTPEQDLERVMTLKECGAMPFVMPYNKNDRYQKSFPRWVNQRAVFKSVKWEEYKYK